MSLLTWSDQMSVGFAAIDGDHQHLIAYSNELDEALRAGKSHEQLARTLTNLVEYAKTHFAREEAFMARFAYPRAAEHYRQHAEFTKKVFEVQARFGAGETAALSTHVLEFLRDWLVNHIQGSDRALGAYLQSKDAA